ncbi:MAG: fumarate reductase [Betaproteobacteria bacterium RBG_16_64_18]|nr:MAG: fumarate reductase [Betaproteobacteria bacterium RBG_16_64_18]OGA07534.1 MAG: fumarate reductase [Betaproteobacteria bacterium RIFCSPLOWO2_02_FULL_65_20]OGA36360.1 MAG: fumarate reductase [Betaproteobacteria bacterium RIFCSPLOWO2_12_FULL_65_110]
MSTQTDKRRPYVRSVDGWWKRDPYYMRYMAMEATSVLVAAYAVILLVGLARLSQGEAAYNGWLEALKSGPSIALHAVILVVFLYHLWSWFKVMPKTMPMIFVDGKKLPPETITYTGVTLAVVVNVIVLIILV